MSTRWFQLSLFTSVVLLLFVVLWMGGRVGSEIQQLFAPAPTTHPLVPPTISPQIVTPTPPLISRVKLYLIEIGDEGRHGVKIGCGDSVVSFNKDILPTSMPLTASLNQLLSIQTQYYPGTELYNALYQSKLTLDKATVTNGVATVYLSGTLRLGGVCDDPRVEAQLTKTVMQFSSVKEAKIYINNVSLHEAVSEK